MFRTATLVLALTLSTTVLNAQAPASKSAPATSAAIRPGTYDIEIAIGGGVLPGTMVLTAIGDSIAAKVSVGDHEPPPVRKITRNGAHLTINLGTDGVDVLYDLDFKDDAVTGKLTFNGDPGLVSGKRRK